MTQKTVIKKNNQQQKTKTSRKAIQDLSLWKRIFYEFRAIWALTEKRWRIELRYPMSLLYFSVSPILWLLPQLIYGSALIGGRFSENLQALVGTNDLWVYSSLGLVFNMFVITTLWSSAFSIRREEWTGTFETIYVTPISRLTLIFGNTLKSLMQNSVGLGLQMGIILYWYWGLFNPLDLFFALFILLISIILVQGISMVFCGIVLWQKQGYRAVLFFEGILMTITPITYPIVTMPSYLQYFAYANPMTYGIEAFRNAILFGTNKLVLSYLGILTVLSIVLLFIGTRIFRKIEKMIQYKGTIGQY